MLYEIGASGRIEPARARTEGELDFVHGPDADTHQEDGVLSVEKKALSLLAANVFLYFPNGLNGLIK